METTYALNENKSLQEIKRPPRIGFIKTFAGTTPPEGTLLCDGSAVSRDTYSDLFDVIGTTWGEGDGETTFNLPDLRDVWILCAGTEHAAGEEVAEGLPNIGGKINIRYPSIANTEGAFTDKLIQSTSVGNLLVDDTGSVQFQQMTFLSSNSNSIYGASVHVTPASVAVLPCIVYE